MVRLSYQNAVTTLLSIPCYMHIYSYQAVSFPRFSPTTFCMHLSPIRATRPAHHILRNFITLVIFGEEYR